MSKIFNVPQSLKDESALSFDDYKKMYEESIKNPSKFWKEQSKRIYWFEDFKTVKDVSFNEENVHIKWFKEGKLNASFNCLDRHLRKNKNKTAIIWEGDDPKENKTYTYEQLHIEVCKFSNALKNIGVKKGDRVTIYLSLIHI